MKKLCLLLLGTVLPVSVFAADVVSLSINSQEDFGSWTYIDANTDGTTWYYDSSINGARYDYDRYNAANDWLISPSVEMEARKVYEITGYVQCPKSMKESFLFTIGQGTSVEDQTTVILPQQTASSVSSYKAYATTFSRVSRYFRLVNKGGTIRIMLIFAYGTYGDTAGVASAGNSG